FRMPHALPRDADGAAVAEIREFVVMAQRESEGVEIVFEADKTHGTNWSDVGPRFVALDRGHGVGSRTEADVPDDEQLLTVSVRPANAPREVRLLDVKTARLFHRRRPHMHNLARRNLPDAGEAFMGDMDLVIA